MGASMALSLRSQLRSSISRKRLFLRVLQRSVTLVALGLILNSSGENKNSIENLRLPGVLQRIGLAYFVVASIETVLMKPQGSFQVGKCVISACSIQELSIWYLIVVFMKLKILEHVICTEVISNNLFN